MEPQMEIKKVVLNCDECAEYLHISRPQVYLGVHNGDIPSIRVGKRILIPVAALEKKLANAGEKSTD